jgi:nitroreductase
MSDFITNQQWRYATKKFDSTKKVSEGDFEFLKHAMQLSASSYGLQPYTIFIIENPETRAQLQPACWGQSQIVDASHLIVIANILNFDDAHIDEFILNLAETRGITPEKVKGYADFMKMKINELPVESRNQWTARQTYLVLGNLMNAAAELKIDVTPMEGFEPEKVNAILGLNEKGLHATLIATIGYRHEDDVTQHYAKVRKPMAELYKTI